MITKLTIISMILSIILGIVTATFMHFNANSNLIVLMICILYTCCAFKVLRYIK